MIDKLELIEELRKGHGYDILASGFDELDVQKVTREFTEEEIEFMEGEWAKILAENPRAYSEIISGIFPERTRVDGNNVHIELYPLEYKHWKTTTEQDSRIWCMGSTGIVRVNHDGDQSYLFGYRKPKITLDVGGVLETFPGGFIDAPYLDLQEPPKVALLNEFQEEVGVPSFYVSDITFLSIGNSVKIPQLRNYIKMLL